MDHAFLLHEGNSSADVYLENVANDIKVKMKTDRPAVVIFTHNKTDENQPSNSKYYGITMEAQSLPNSIYINQYKDRVILKANEKFESTTTYTIYNE